MLLLPYYEQQQLSGVLDVDNVACICPFCRNVCLIGGRKCRLHRALQFEKGLVLLMLLYQSGWQRPLKKSDAQRIQNIQLFYRSLPSILVEEHQ